MVLSPSPLLSPLRLSPSAYSWDEAVAVTFDRGEERLIHVMSDGFYAISVGKNAPMASLFVSLSAFGGADWVRDVRIAPSEKHMCIHGRPGGNVCCLWINNLKNPSYKTGVPVMFKKGGADVDLLQFYWAKSNGEAHDDLVVVTTAGVEVFQISYEPVSVRSMRWYPMNIRLAWTSPIIVLVGIGSKSLQPLNLQSARPWLPKFDLYVQSPIAKENVDLVTLYGMAFCVHMDQSRQRLSLRNVSDPSQSAPEYDVVIDLSSRGDSHGHRLFRVAVCDNLLLIHESYSSGTVRAPSRMFWLYDIKCPSTSLWESDLPMLDENGHRSEDTPDIASFFGRHIIDMRQQLRSFEIDMPALRLYMRKSRSLDEVLRILLRRSDCRADIMFELREALTREDLDEWQRCCVSLTTAYRSAIEQVTSQNVTKHEQKRATVSLSSLMASPANLSILSEKDVVMNVFYPHLIERFPRAVSPDGDELLLQPLELTEAEKAGGAPIRAPYFVLAVTGYMRSLLNKSILPHRILQGFVFDILIIFRQHHLLQQMLHYHVLIDSEDILSRLRHLALETRERWIVQACQDMAHRLKDYSLVAEILLGVDRPFDALAFVISRGLSEYPLRNIFAQLDSDDVDSAAAEVQNWMVQLADTDREVPNLEGCERWGFVEQET
eukprot:GEMP01031759.1.p1 GENE.GEMP01031759.1~~GEMP01031759.1.p1  ORF type:complete len:662 (+),score=142.96 GEMP01031759.1:144-2129(+)